MPGEELIYINYCAVEIAGYLRIVKIVKDNKPVYVVRQIKQALTLSTI